MSLFRRSLPFCNGREKNSNIGTLQETRFLKTLMK